MRLLWTLEDLDDWISKKRQIIPTAGHKEKNSVKICSLKCQKNELDFTKPQSH